MKRSQNLRKRFWALLLSLVMVLQAAPFQAAAAPAPDSGRSDGGLLPTAPEIHPVSASSYSSDEAHSADKAIDGKMETYWQSPGANTMRDYYRHIDIALDGQYDLTDVAIFNVPDSYYHYQVYASSDGENFYKIAYKNSDEVATSNGDFYDVSGEEQAKNVCALRVNMAYNSASMEGNLAEIKVYGTKVSDTVPTLDKIQVTDFADSSWGTEYEKFESDPAYAKEKTLASLSDMVGRVIGEEWKDDFVFHLENVGTDSEKDAFSVESADGKIHIRGRNALSLASGFNYYLKNYAHVNFNPLFTSNVEMPAALPAVPEKVVKETQYDVRYALNFCTYAYTMAFWGWEEYEPFLDWCAMNGVTIMLDIVGQEEVQRRLLTKYGYTDQEVKDYISGPGYYPWFYMDNMSNFGGPLPNSWFEQRVELGRQMHDRMQVYGIQPVMQGFAGQVPVDFGKKNGEAAIVPQGKWCGFARPYMLRTYETTSDGEVQPSAYFDRMADDFYQIQKDVFGEVTDYYAVDPFHEGGQTGGMDLPTVYRVVQQKMLDADSNAHWVLMQWQGQISNEKISNLADPSKALILDLQADQRSYSSVMENNKTPWVWCMLHNFGGRMGVDGDIITISQAIPEAYDNSNYMVGIGITPEAFGNTPVVYDLLFDMTWTKDPIDYRQWLDTYVESRYGSANSEVQSVWETLLETAYAEKTKFYQGAAESVICDRPSESFTSASSWGHSNFQYDTRAFEEALPDFIAAYEDYQDVPAFLYDMTDITKQVLATSAIEYHRAMIKAYRDKDLAKFQQISGQFLELIRLMDDVLACSSDFTVGKWIGDSRDMYEGMDDWTKDLFEFNARAQITTWGASKNGSLLVYSNRQWAGLVEDYYLVRWEAFVDAYTKALQTGSNPENVNYFMIEWEWANRKSDEGSDGYSRQPSGEDLKALAQRVYDEFSLANLDSFLESKPEDPNVAEGKTVTSTVNGSNLSLLTDGDTAINWMADTSGAVSFTLDLDGTYDIRKIAFAMPQVAGDYAWDFALSVYTEEDSWEEIPVEQQDTLLGTIETACAVRGSQVKYTFTPKETAPDGLTAEFAELYVCGTEVQEDLGINVASEGAVTASKGDASKMTDGDRTNFWTTDDQTFPAWVEIDFGALRDISGVKLAFVNEYQQEQKYKVELLDSERQTVASYEDNDDQLKDALCSIPVTGSAQYVRLTLTGRIPDSICWPGAAELEVYEKSTEPEHPEASADLSKNIAPLASASASKERESVRNMIDGNRGNFWATGDSHYPAWVELDFGDLQNITGVKLAFVDSNQQNQKYKVELLDADRKVIDEYADADDTKKDAVCDIPVTGEAWYVRLTLTGLIAGQSCWPGAAELEVYALPEPAPAGAEISSAVTPTAGKLEDLLDNNPDTGVTAGAGEFVLTYPSNFDLSAVELVSNSLQDFDVFYAAADGQWQEITTRGKSADGSWILEVNTPALVRRIKLVNRDDSMVLADINVYCYDYRGEFTAYLSDLIRQAEGYTIGSAVGNIPREAKDTFDRSIQQIQAAEAVNSQNIDDLMAQADAAFYALKRSVIYLDRSGLLGALSDAQWFGRSGFTAIAVELEDEIAAARAVYDKKDVTQTELDTAAKTLNDAIAPLYEAAQAFTVQLDAAKALAENAVVGSEPGNVTMEELDALRTAIETAEQAAAAATSVEGLNAAAAELKAACDEFVKISVESITVSVAGNGKPEISTGGGTLQLEATVLPAGANRGVVWSVSPAGLASISSDGLLTASANGTVTVTATAADGSGVTGTLEVVISNQPSSSGSTTTRYTITVTQATGGKISPSTTSVTKGSDKTFTVTANEGYKISDVLVDGKSVGAVSSYTFKNVTAKHTISAKFEKVSAADTFTDIKSTDWFAEAVEYVVDKGLMNGTSPVKFTPNGDTTRGMIVTILYRQAGSQAVESDGAAWWSDARVWAMANGVSDGTNMDKEITREQLATMLYCYAELMGEDVSKTTSLDSFQDGGKVSGYAADALKWAAAESIVTGKTGNVIDPQAGATRAETATMLMRFCEIK